jgi:protein-S-isoprenylcysteine O-methyltransferase Ste14
VPLAVLTLVPLPRWGAAAVLLVLAGEALRLWAVGHIGRRSRTREAGVGALVDVGPYARMRNPLYVGNLLIWSGFGLAGWPTLLVVLPALVLHYNVIVRWEEGRLADTIGAPYRDYLQRVPRWVPTGAPRAGAWDVREALRSERGTFAVLALLSAASAARCYLPG